MSGALFGAIARLPIGTYVRIWMERDEEDGHEWLDASLWQVAPSGDNGEGGWPDGHPADQYADRILCGVSAVDYESLERLLLLAIEKRATQ